MWGKERPPQKFSRLLPPPLGALHWFSLFRKQEGRREEMAELYKRDWERVWVQEGSFRPDDVERRDVVGRPLLWLPKTRSFRNIQSQPVSRDTDIQPR